MCSSELEGYASYGLFGAALMVLAVVGSAAAQHRIVAQLPERKPGRFSLTGAFAEIFDAFREKAFVIFALGGLAAYVLQGMTFSIANYLNVFVWQLDRPLFAGAPDWFTGLLGYAASLFLSVVLMFLIVGHMHRAFGKAKSAVIGAFGSVTLGLAPYALFLAGVWPEAGTTASTLTFLAMLLFEKYGQHQPLNRQAERFAREGVPLSTSTLADQVGAASFALMPLYLRIEAHVLAARRLHGDDTTVPVLAKGKTDTARLWVYVRDDRPFAGSDPPAALFHYSRDRRGEHPRAHLASWAGILQADAYGGYNELYAPGRQPAPVIEAGCFAHARRKFFELADVEAAARRKSRGQRTGMIYPIALEAVQRLDALFEIERGINGKAAEERVAVRQDFSAPLMTDLHAWLTAQLAKLSRSHDLAKAINYMRRRWDAFTRFLGDGRICLTNNAAERALRCVPLGRKAWLFCGSDRGGQRAAVLYSLIQTARLNDVDPQAWLADVLARLPDMPLSRLPELLPWNWSQTLQRKAA